MSTIVANYSIRDSTYDPVNVWKRAMALHVVVPRLVAIVFRQIILIVIPLLKEIRISVAGLGHLM